MKPALLLIISLIMVFSVIAQPQRQTVKGTITDKISEKPLAGATVTIDPGNNSTFTDENGNFSVPGILPGRIRLTVSYSGYQTASLPEVLVTSGKEVVLELALEQNVSSLDAVVVKGSRVKKGAVNNEFAANSARSFNIEEVTRYAGGRNDPSKLVSNFAGVISGNDSRNDIIVRGNSPAGVLWRIEGLPSPNPNHFSALGTTGGPVSALNTNALKTSDFYTGAFTAEYGNAIAAVFDISLRTGNTQKHERTLQLNLFSGLEAMLEGPIGKKGGSYLAGYRYSFVQIGQSLGIEVGTAAVPKYQDWVFNLQSAKTKWGRFSIFGMGGLSNIDFIGKNIDTTDFYSRKDQDTYFTSNFSILGAKHTIDVGKTSFIRTLVSYSYVKSSLDAFQYELPLPPYVNRWQVTDLSDQQNMLRFSTLFNAKTNASFSFRTGITGEHFGLKTVLFDRTGQAESAPYNLQRNYDDRFFLLQYFGQVRYKPLDKLTVVAGVHGMNFSFNQTNMLAPRASILFSADTKNTFSFSYGLHGQLQALPVYLYQEESGGVTIDNRQLDFNKAHHYVLGYENRFAKDWRGKVEIYQQSLFNIPVEPSPSGFSILNAGSDFTFPEKAGLVNTGTGKNTGVELTIEKFLSSGYYLLTTGSIFESTYKGSDGIERNSTFNYGYAFNVLAGREWKIGREGRKAFTVDFRLSALGGKYATPVDVAASRAQGKEVLDESRYNSERLTNYLRMDTKFGIRINSKKRKLSQTFFVDLQNITNRDNIFLQRYNPVYGTVGNVNQIGFFPDILYRLQF